MGCIMTVLVVGGDGFVGNHIVDLLVMKKIDSVVYDINSDSKKNREFCTYVKGDLQNTALIDDLIQKNKVTYIIHLASTTLPKSSNENIQFDISTNLMGTIGLLDLCVKHKLKKILFMSSGGTVYGLTTYLPVDENHPTNPICSYGINKLAIEKYLHLYSHLYGLNFIVLRAANPYGQGQNPLKGQGIIANFVHKMTLGEPLQVWGDGTVVRDYFNVRDLASLTLKALFSESCGVFNAGSGVGLSIHDLINVVAENFLITPNVILSEKRKLDVNSIILDCTKARKVFSWQASTDIKSGVADYIRWYSRFF